MFTCHVNCMCYICTYTQNIIFDEAICTFLHCTISHFYYLCVCMCYVYVYVRGACVNGYVQVCVQVCEV